MSTGFDPFSIYLKALSNAQEMFQLTTKMWSNTQKVQQAQQSVEQLWQEYMNTVSDTVSLGMSMQQLFNKYKNPEDSMKAAEKLVLEYGEKSVVHAKNFLNIFHRIWQETYQYTKDNAADFTEKYTEAAKNITDHVNKFTETASNVCCNAVKTTTNVVNNAAKKQQQHHNTTTD